MDLTLRLVDGLSEFSALILWVEKNMTLFYIYCNVCYKNDFCYIRAGDFIAGYYYIDYFIAYLNKMYLISFAYFLKCKIIIFFFKI